MLGVGFLRILRLYQNSHVNTWKYFCMIYYEPLTHLCHWLLIKEEEMWNTFTEELSLRLHLVEETRLQQLFCCFTDIPLLSSNPLIQNNKLKCLLWQWKCVIHKMNIYIYIRGLNVPGWHALPEGEMAYLILANKRKKYIFHIVEKKYWKLGVV